MHQEGQRQGNQTLNTAKVGKKGRKIFRYNSEIQKPLTCLISACRNAISFLQEFFRLHVFTIFFNLFFPHSFSLPEIDLAMCYISVTSHDTQQTLCMYIQ